VDGLTKAMGKPFYDPAVYGPNGYIHISTDLSKVIQPMYTAMPLEHPGIHIRGSSETYIHAASKEKKLDITCGDISGYPYTKEACARYMQFFDHFLKGKDNGVMDQPPVRMMVRTGRGGYFWQVENEWPIARTKYTRYYLDTSASNWAGDGRRKDFMKLTANPLASEASRTYSAQVNLGTPPPNPPPIGFRVKNIGADPGWSHGVSFITEPLSADMLLAGYIKVGLWVSSTSSDMDIVAGIRIIDENNQELPYSLSGVFGAGYSPVATGWLKVSHRKTDPAKSTEYRPYHTHTQGDYQPLKPGEVVEAEVEIWPTTALVRKGYRIRLDIQPTDGFDHPVPHTYDPSYHDGASNTIYTGPNHPCYLQLPVIPVK
jgi:putative CocE/NonD family hydrolase